MIYDIYTYNGRSDMFVVFSYYCVRNLKSQDSSIADLLLTLFFSSWLCDLRNDFYTYFQTCINICFTIQNAWEAGNILAS